jgi:hypothetical protein
MWNKSVIILSCWNIVIPSDVSPSRQLCDTLYARAYPFDPLIGISFQTYHPTTVEIIHRNRILDNFKTKCAQYIFL